MQIVARPPKNLQGGIREVFGRHPEQRATSETRQFLGVSGLFGGGGVRISGKTQGESHILGVVLNKKYVHTWVSVGRFPWAVGFRSFLQDNPVMLVASPGLDLNEVKESNIGALRAWGGFSAAALLRRFSGCLSAWAGGCE